MLELSNDSILTGVGMLRILQIFDGTLSFNQVFFSNFNCNCVRAFLVAIATSCFLHPRLGLRTLV